MNQHVAPRTRVPDPAKKHVRSFCNRVVPDGEPILLAIEAEADSQLNDCMNIVKARILADGGGVVYGWGIWELPNVLIEAEFHAVWEDDSGSLRDISPAPAGVASRLFLPDPNRRYEGKMVDNIRHPLTDHPAALRLIKAREALFEVLNKGDRAYIHGPMPIPQEELQPILRVQQQASIELASRPVGRNKPCPCGSGKKYKRCCGQ